MKIDKSTMSGGADMKATDNQNQPEQKNNIKEIISWIKWIIGAVGIAILLNAFIILSVKIPSGSMMDTIQKGNRLFGLRLTYLLSDPQRGDIAVFNYPVDDALGTKNKYIKRIIGLPGETVEINNSKVYITPADGSEKFELDEPYLKDKGEAWTVANGSPDALIFQVPEDSYFMMGDNRNNSSDGRYWAMCAMRDFAEAGKNITIEDAISLQYVKREQILGKAYVRYWPLTEISILK